MLYKAARKLLSIKGNTEYSFRQKKMACGPASPVLSHFLFLHFLTQRSSFILAMEC